MASLSDKCIECGNTSNLKRGWTMSLYCCENCERSSVSRLHGSMPGAGSVPYHNWVPDQISREIAERWKDDNLQ